MSDMGREISFAGRHGAGVYGREDRSRKHKCGKCFNPYLREGNPECENAPKPAPLTDPEPAYPVSRWPDA